MAIFKNQFASIKMHAFYVVVFSFFFAASSDNCTLFHISVKNYYTYSVEKLGNIIQAMHLHADDSGHIMQN